MSITLSDLTYRLAKALNIVSEGTATSGSQTTIGDNVERIAEADDYWIGGTAWILYDAGGAGAAPQGEYAYISDSVQSTGVITLRSPGFTVAVAAGDKYALGRKRYPLQLLIQKINEAFGVVEKTDTTTIAIVDGQLEYSLPADVYDLKEVWLQTDLDANNWQRVYDYDVQKSATGTANKLVFRSQFLAGYSVKVVYSTYHQTLRAYTDKLDDSIHADKIVWNAAVGCLLWRKSRVGDSDTSVNDLLNFYQNLAAKKESEAQQLISKRSSKTIHPVFRNR